MAWDTKPITPSLFPPATYPASETSFPSTFVTPPSMGSVTVSPSYAPPPVPPEVMDILAGRSTTPIKPKETIEDKLERIALALEAIVERFC